MLLAACGDDAPPMEDPVCTGDAQCDDGIYCNGTERCAPTEAGATLLGCVGGASPCPANEACIETEMTCDDSCSMPDGDGDGVDRIDCGGNDCDDMDASRFPGNTEICDDGHDEDCDLNTVGTLDRDRDGFIDARCSNDEGASGTDCNDLEVAISPGASEFCNGRDDDCDGDVDEGVSIAGFVDADADGRGDSSTPMNACASTVRFALIGEDCDDGDIAVQPVQNEICDSKDNDCDGDIDEDARPAIWYRDVDGDGYGDVDGDRVVQCDVPPGYSLLPTDCDDNDEDISPLAVESCNAIDDDCNGVADFPVPGAGLEDDDQDGIADSGCGGDDCDDLDPFVGAGLPEYCNGRDDDCDGMVDEGLTESDYFADTDGDGYGAGPAMPLCGDVPGLVPRAGDCNDGDPGTTPGAIERCDNIDNDCDGSVDEGASSSCTGANALYTCIDGFCEIAQCTGTFGDCDLRASTGCETDLAVTDTNVQHCGACGGTCADCIVGTCPGSPVALNATGTVYTAMGTEVDGIPVFVPGTAPLLSTTTGPSGGFGLELLTPDPIAVGGGSCYPTLYNMTGSGNLFPDSPFLLSSDVIPLDGAEVELLEARTSFQRADRGMVAIFTENPPVDPGIASLNLNAEGPVGFSFFVDSETRVRTLTPQTSDRLGGSSSVDLLVFTNVEPGPLQVQVDGCVVDINPGFVAPGVLTVVAVECAAPG